MRIPKLPDMGLQTDGNRVRSLAQQSEFVIGRVGELGHAVGPTSRLSLERKVFFDDRGALRVVQPDDPEFGTALEALRDFTLFEFILDPWPFDLRNEAANRRLKTAMRDAVDPYAPGAHTRGRDTQLELFVAVALHRSGLPVEFEPPGDDLRPDVRTKLDGRGFYVEAKRPKSRDAVLDAVRIGARQIRATGCPGAIFLDVSRAFNPAKGLVTRMMDDEEFRRLHVEALRRAVQTIDEPLGRILVGKAVACICFQDHQLRQVPGGWKLESKCMTFPNPHASARLGRLGDLFDRSLSHAW